MTDRGSVEEILPSGHHIDCILYPDGGSPLIDLSSLQI